MKDAYCYNDDIFFSDARTNNSLAFGPGNGAIYGTSILCTAEEDQLADCTFSNDVSACTHSLDAGLTCNRDRMSHA